jgi:soluble P-type ATPase
MSKLRIDIPGWGSVDIKNIVIDLNGTIATDGRIPLEVKEKIGALSNLARIYILTADPPGPANEEILGMKAELIKVPEEDSKQGKLDFLKTLNLEMSVAIGNGSNDQLILKEAALGIAVLGDAGVSVSAIKSADIVVKDIQSALDLFLKFKRLITILGE